ncbi:MAG: methyltransferase [Pseudomonadota bacterium]
MRPLLTTFAAYAICTCLLHAGTADQAISELSELATASHRSQAHIARNQFRNPTETLVFFGLKKDMTVVEISPGGAGWYTEILAPYLRESGKLYAASYDTSAGGYFERNAKAFDKKLADNPSLYDGVVVTTFNPPSKLEGSPPGTADMVVTFRNLHNYLEDGAEEIVFKAMFNMLKPGGILGIVQHRAITEDFDPSYGYVSEAKVLSLASAAGFKLVAKSETNANPKDTRDHPEGVWTLPPSFELGDKDREKYAEIGESDRMTMKFVKPIK